MTHQIPKLIILPIGPLNLMINEPKATRVQSSLDADHCV